MTTDVATELRERLQVGSRDSAGVNFDVEEVEVLSTNTTAKVRVSITVSALEASPERWLVTLPYSGKEAQSLSGTDSEETLRYLAFIVRTHLHEWWHTKAHEKYSQKLEVRRNDLEGS